MLPVHTRCRAPMSACSGQQPADSLLTYRLIRPLYSDGPRPRRAGPAPCLCPPRPGLALNLSRLEPIDGTPVRVLEVRRAAMHTPGLRWPGFQAVLVLCGVLSSVLFSSRAPPFTSSLPTRNPPAPIPFPDPEPQLQSSLQSAPAAIVLMSRPATCVVRDDDAFMTFRFCGDL